MLEVVFFAVAVALVGHYLRQMSPGRPARVGAKTVSGELTQLVEYADRAYLEKKYLSAEKLYLKILKIDHKNASAYRRIGLIYSAQRKYPDAIESFQVAAHLDPSAVNYYNLGVTYYENANYIKAIAAFDKGLIFDQTPDLYDAIGRTQLNLNHPNEAVEAFEKATANPKNKQHLTHLAEAYELVGKKDLAKVTYEKILKIDPKDVKAARALRRPATV